MLELQGIVQAVEPREVTTKWGPKQTQQFTINGETLSGGFKKWSANPGDELFVTYETNGSYKNIKSLTVVAAGSGAAVPSAPKSTPKAGFKGRSFPVDPLAPERTINRQNALTAAVNGMGTICEGCSTEGYANAVIDMARRFEAYTTGDLDVEEAKALAGGE